MYWELGVIGLATIGAYGEVEEDVMTEARDGIGKGVLVIVVIAAIKGLREVYLVEQFIIEIEMDEMLVPIHTP